MKSLKLSHRLESILKKYDCGALATSEGQILFLKFESISDIGTLGLSTQTVGKYFPLNLYDAAILNDPYSGGNLLSNITLVTPLYKAHGPHLSDLLLAVRIGFRPKLSFQKSIEEEGLRIPPTPIAQNRVINTDILRAMQAHPLCPQDLSTRVSQTLQNMFETAELAQNLIKQDPDLFSKFSIRDYLKDSRQKTEELISDLPNTDCKVSTSLDHGETIQLLTEITEKKIIFDFRGTSASQKLCLTDAATFGACFGAVSAFLETPILFNSGSFECVEVRSPLGCLLNAKYPSPTFKGMTDGTSLVASTALRALSTMYPQRETSMSAVAPSKIEIQFDNGLRFYDVLPGGTGASSHSHGSDCMSFWMRQHLEPSVEEIERRFPLLVKKINVRLDSGGKGQFTGGNGLMKKYELLSPATVTWSLEQTKNKPQGLKGAQAGHAAEIQILHGDEKKSENLSFEGQLKLKTGDKIILSSAGGGGWGKAQAIEEAKQS